MRIAVIGAGGIGGPFGAALAKAGEMATIDAHAVIQRILAHLGLPGARAGPRPPSSGAAARAGQPALPDMTLEQVPGARATAAVCAERPGGRRPFAA